MRSRFRLLTLLAIATPSFALAQPAVTETEPAEEQVDPAEETPAYEEEVVEEEPETTATETVADEPETGSAATPTTGSTVGRRRRWLAPEPTLTLHGYMRVRGEWQDHFALGRVSDSSSIGRANYPFSYFLPTDVDATVPGGCHAITASETCFHGSDRLRYANMRMRLQPSLSLSDDVRVHMVMDVFDNMVLGSTPDSSSYGATLGESTASGVPLDFFTRTLNPAVAGRNSLGQSIYVRRAWAEVSNRDLGELRFGRMANHWGLGMLWNGGAGIDSDYSTDVDRVMVSRQLFGYTLGAAWDFTNQGVTVFPGNLNGIPHDGSEHDGVRQFSFFAARSITPEQEAERVANGHVVVVGGVYYQYRSQNYAYAPAAISGTSGATFEYANSLTPGTYIRRSAASHTVDGWARLRYKTLRVELEAALTVGHIRNLNPAAFTDVNLRLLQFGYALEAEYRALDGHKLGVYFNTGYATGDRDVNGISIREDTMTQDSTPNSDGRATTFTFHPNYRLDLILFRNILGSMAGAYYFRPGISYDIIRNEQGGLFGIRADVVYSRASSAVQAYGNSASLGLELDGSVYYRSEDGPDLLDGYWVSFHYGLLFPLAGLGYRTGELLNPPSLGKAQTMRIVLGVNF